MFIIGDTHGLPTLLNVLQDFWCKPTPIPTQLGLSQPVNPTEDITDATFIHVGDVGLGFDPIEVDIHNLQVIDKLLQEKQCKMYMIRGNHDNPHFWNYSYVYKHKLLAIELVNDFMVREIEKEMVLFIGGATSIDRNLRTLGKDYWLDEGVPQIPLDVMDMKGQYYDVTMVVTHCAPFDTHPLIDNPIARFGEQLGKELIAERQYLSDLRDRLPKTVKRWYYGHYHTSSVNYDQHIRYECVDENTIVECRL